MADPVADWDDVAADELEDDCVPERSCDDDCEPVKPWLDDGVLLDVAASLDDCV